jgi:hypothetical protein
MSTDRPPRASMSIEEATVSNMWEIVAIVLAIELKALVHTTITGGGAHFPASS